MIKAPWRALSALALLAAIGCGDDDGTEPEGSISVSASPSTLTVQQGASGTVTVTLTRGGGFSESVNVTVEGLPTGVTASVSPSTLTGTTTQAVVTVNVASTVAAGNYPVTVRASAAGIGAATAQYTLTVTAAPTANYALSATAASVAQGGSGTSTISIQRTNFTGPVTLTLENPPAGITGSFNPTPATGDQSTLTINVAGTVTPGTYTLNVKGAATGPGDKTTTVALTVTAAQAANYTLSATPAALTINAGANSTTTVNIARTNFTGTVNLTLDAPPAGITATFNPAAATGNSSIATINVAGTVAPGNHTLTIKGTATGIADKTTTVTLTVGAAAGFTIAASPTALTIAPGANSTSNVTIVRTNFTTDVALSLVNPPAGITGTFTPATLTGTNLSSSLQVNVAGTVTAGTYPLTVQGVGGSVTQTTTINVTVAAAGSVTLAMQPTSLSIQQGSSGNATLNLTRTNFTGNVTPSVTGNPAGMTVTFNPNPITGNSAQVTVNVGASVPAATYPLTITGAAGAAGNPTTTLSVQVTAQSGGQNLTWDFCTAEGVPLKFWRLSGGTWAEVTPTVVGNVTRFSFSIASTSGGVAFTMQAAGFQVRSRAVAPSKLAGMIASTKRARERTNAMRLTNQTLPQTSSFFDTFVQLGLTSELGGYAEVCETPGALVSKTFNVSGMGATEVGSLGYGPAGASLVPGTPSYNLMVPTGSYDWGAVFGPAPALPDFASNWTAYRIGRNEAAPGAAVAVNRTGATPFVTVPFTVTGGSAGSIYLFSEFIEGSRGSIMAFSIGSPFSSSSSGNMLFLAPADRLASDLTAFTITNVSPAGGNNSDIRFQTRYFGAPPANAAFTLPGTVPAFTVTQVAGAPVPTWSATGAIPAEYQLATSPVTVSFEGNNSTAIVTVSATRGWLLANNMATNYTLTQPTLPNFLSQWAPAAPLLSTLVLMLGYDELAAPTAGSVLNFAGRLQMP